jgi:FkbM family methyltransferase
MSGHRIGRHYIMHDSDIHEAWEQQHLRNFFARYHVDCVFDVGANYGQYATMLREAVGFEGLIVSFEPIPAAAVALRKACRNCPNWIIEEVALSGSDGFQQFNIMSGSQFSSLSEPRHNETALFQKMNRVADSATVRTETLVTAYHRLLNTFGFQRPFLKLDTQGFDVEIVMHGKPVLPHFLGLQSELAIKKLYKDSVDFREALKVYEECGFELSAFVPNNAGHFPLLVETDCIMIRKDLL